MDKITESLINNWDYLLLVGQQEILLFPSHSCTHIKGLFLLVLMPSRVRSNSLCIRGRLTLFNIGILKPFPNSPKQHLICSTFCTKNCVKIDKMNFFPLHYFFQISFQVSFQISFQSHEKVLTGLKLPVFNHVYLNFYLQTVQ